MSPLKDNIWFILVRTQFASNLGSAVRAIKNMGFHKLMLVQPECEVGMEARSFAMRGAHLLDNAQFSPSLKQVSQQVNLLVGTTGRFRGEKARLTTSHHFCQELLPRVAASSLGIVFGSEDNGLRRAELQLCQWLLEIPTDSDYPVLNLAQAVAIVSYEIHLSLLNQTTEKTPLNRASAAEIEYLMEHTERALTGLQLPRRLSVRRMVARLRKIAARAELEREDVRLLQGLLSELERR